MTILTSLKIVNRNGYSDKPKKGLLTNLYDKSDCLSLKTKSRNYKFFNGLMPLSGVWD